MRKVYKSKVDAWLVIVITGLTLIPVAPVLYPDFSLVVFCIVVAILGFVMALLFGIRYVVCGKYLVVKYGFLFSERFHIDDIQSIKSTKTMLSAPAASMDRIELKFCNGSVVISPKDKVSFIKSIQETCSHEINIIGVI
ncbi:MAG: PH domain-containing protein [Bacteroidales bacterium]|nr:PH domain-containing protein [Bacteroidales bacterium]MCM1148428.1 PH domain-containing protein [Bacteroidales bacterium]MCM1207056.1 PH domain-containing protein [Bacillota bacterium]MCM1510798.1 PH domain-containing protein [Clostridium sp.]